MKNLLINSIFIAFLSLAGVAANAQQRPAVFGRPIKSVNPNNGLVRCVSSEYEEYRGESGLKSNTQDFETWIGQKIKEQKQQQKSTNSTNVVITIPVVVHVIHNGDAVGQNENIADAQVLSQITVLNQDYRRMFGTPGYNTEDVGADVEIEFCLAHTAPDGSYTSGIDRVQFPQATWNTEEAIEGVMKPQTIWDPYSYFNIWVCSFGGDMNGILGYAQFPTGAPIAGLPTVESDETDGVVIGYRYFGSGAIYPQGVYDNANGYNRGRTATHEIGHALGLRHIWGDGGSQQFNFLDCNATDYVADTPFAGWENWDCLDVYDSCPAKAGADMTNNYMDYTNDACMNIFTANQKTRMIAVMNNSPRRETLKTSTVCQDPTAGLEDRSLNNIYLYPNPAQTVVTISGFESNMPDSYTVYNSLGQTIATAKVNGTADLTVNTSAYANGVYIIKVESGRQSKTFKFVKN